MAKLEYYGIRGQTKSWIENWFTSRVQQVVIDGETSREEVVKSGVPQGTVLGPLIFLICINDIGLNISSTIRLFADDALIYRYVNNKEDSDILQKDLDQLCAWENKWQMSFNPSKCSVMRVTRKKKVMISNYIIHGQILSRTSPILSSRAGVGGGGALDGILYIYAEICRLNPYP